MRIFSNPKFEVRNPKQGSKKGKAKFPKQTVAVSLGDS